MIGSENKILFKEIKSYEEAYFYNSSPEERNKATIKNSIEDKKRSSKVKRFFESPVGEIIESAIGIFFDILN